MYFLKAGAMVAGKKKQIKISCSRLAENDTWTLLKYQRNNSVIIAIHTLPCLFDSP